MDKSHDISVLNGLIETTLDSYTGYNDACADGDGRHSQMFQQMAEDRSSVTSRLQQQVAGLGGEPEDESSYGAAAHRGFMDLKQAVMGSSEQAISAQKERSLVMERFEDGELGEGEAMCGGVRGGMPLDRGPRARQHDEQLERR